MKTLVLIIVITIIILIVLWLFRGKKPSGHYIGAIHFAPEVGLSPEALTMTVHSDGTTIATSRLEFPEIIPSEIPLGDIESTWSGKIDCNGDFYSMSYRQGNIPQLFGLQNVPSLPNYVMVLTGKIKVTDVGIETSSVKLSIGPLDWSPPNKLYAAIPLTKLSLKKYSPKAIMNTTL